MSGQQPDAPAGILGDLEYLGHHWGTAYLMGYGGGQFTADRRDGKGGTLTGPDRDGLDRQIRADYRAHPVLRDLPLSGDLAAWLRGQRETRGWSRLEMARQLITASQAADRPVTSPARTLEYSVGRWERGLLAPGERYRLLYCAAFGIARALFGGGQQQARQRALAQRRLDRFRDICGGMAGAAPGRPRGADANGASPQPDEACWCRVQVSEKTPAGDETVQRCARSWTACSG